MTRYLFFLFFTCLGVGATYGQATILPGLSSEQCPLTNVSFTVTLPGTGYSMPSVQGWGGPGGVVAADVVSQSSFSTVGSNTRLTFVGRFQDDNRTQAFRLSYEKGGVPGSETFRYTRVKSFFQGAVESRPQLNLPNIIAPVCAVTTFSVSFAKVKYVNVTPPKIVFGEASDYEYLLPAGWKLGTTTSNGSAWIAGSNNATITTDLNTGNGSFFRVRAVNSCGTSLVRGPEAQIPIFRRRPSAINGPTVLCSGSATYSLNEPLIAGGGIVWSVSNPSLAVISGSATDPTVTLTRTGTGSGNVVLSASINDCSGTYVLQYTIAVGPPGNVTLQVNPPAFDFCNTSYLEFDATVENAFQASLFWSVVGSGAKVKFGASGYTPVFLIYPSGTFEIVGEISNSCGTTYYSSGEIDAAGLYTSYCPTPRPAALPTENAGPADYSSRFILSPNPGRGDDLRITFPEKIPEEQEVTIRLYGVYQARFVKTWTFPGGQDSYALKAEALAPGQYAVEVGIGAHRTTRQWLVKD